MARRLEKSGELIFCYGAPEELATEKRGRKNRRGTRRFFILVALVAGALWVGMHAGGWPAVSNTLKALLAAIW